MKMIRITLIGFALFFLATMQARAQVAKSLMDAETNLTVLSLPGLIEAGETDPGIDWVSRFEADSGCKVDIATAPSPEALERRLRDDPVDVVIAAGEWVDVFRRTGLLAEINPGLIPGFANMDPRLARAPTGGANGKFYGIALHWAPWVMVYDRNAFKQPPDGMRPLFEPMTLADGNTARGRILAWGRPLAIAQAALYLRTKHPELGVRDPFALSEAQYAAALELMRAQHRLNPRNWVSSDDQLAGFLTKGAVAGMTWPLQAETLAAKNRPFNILRPKEGVLGWIDGAMLTAKARNPGCAYRFFDHMLTPDVNGDLAAWYGTIPSVTDACTASNRLSPAVCEGRGAALIDKVEFTRLPDEACDHAGRADCVRFDRWRAAWAAIQRE